MGVYTTGLLYLGKADCLKVQKKMSFEDTLTTTIEFTGKVTHIHLQQAARVYRGVKSLTDFVHDVKTKCEEKVSEITARTPIADQVMKLAA